MRRRLWCTDPHTSVPTQSSRNIFQRFVPGMSLEGTMEHYYFLEKSVAFALEFASWLLSKLDLKPIHAISNS